MRMRIACLLPLCVSLTVLTAGAPRAHAAPVTTVSDEAPAEYRGPLTPIAAGVIAFSGIMLTGGGAGLSLGAALFDPTERKAPRVVQFAALGGGAAGAVLGVIAFLGAGVLVLIDATVFAE